MRKEAGILKIRNRTENWRTAKMFSPFFLLPKLVALLPIDFLSHLVRNLNLMEAKR